MLHHYDYHDYACNTTTDGCAVCVDALYIAALNAPMLEHRCAITTVNRA